MATYRKRWQCRGLIPHPGLVGTDFPVFSEAKIEIGRGRVVEVAGDTMTFDLEILGGGGIRVAEAAGDIRAIAVHRAKDDRDTVALVDWATFEKSSSYTEPEDKDQPYAPMERMD